MGHSVRIYFIYISAYNAKTEGVTSEEKNIAESCGRKKNKKEKRSEREQGADINFGAAAAATLIKPRF